MPLDRWSQQADQRPAHRDHRQVLPRHRREHPASWRRAGRAAASAIDTKEVGESALEAALPWDRIAGVPFKTSAGSAAAPASAAAWRARKTARAQHDPDYRWLVADIAALDTVRDQKSVSLNLKVRREERTRIDKERLERENSRRAAKNQPPFKTSRNSTRPRTTHRRRARSGQSGHGGHRDRRASADRAAEDRTQRLSSTPAPRGLSAAAPGTGPRCPRRARWAGARRRHPAAASRARPLPRAQSSR